MNVDSNTVRRILIVVLVIFVAFLLFNFEARSGQIGREQTEMNDTIQELERNVYKLQTTIDEVHKQFDEFEKSYGNHINNDEQHNF